VKWDCNWHGSSAWFQANSKFLTPHFTLIPHPNPN
jgi:hypothetical protein